MVDTDIYNIFIPYRIGDIISPEGFDNQFIIEDIIVVRYTRNKDIKIILNLKDIDFKYNSLFNYNDYKWKMIKSNEKELNENEV